MTDNIELMELAKKASRLAYAPYSKFRVGACVLYESGKYYTGCNVENASYGLSLCAERNAISNAIASGETDGLLKIAIFCRSKTGCMPCGACRQWIAEFKKYKEIEIITETEDSHCSVFTISELLPYNFSL
jgi:cytidine deaminase